MHIYKGVTFMVDAREARGENMIRNITEEDFVYRM